MERIRWLRFVAPAVSLRQLATRMLDREYCDGRSDGFLVSQATNERVSGRYVERDLHEETVRDPFGEATSYTVLKYSEVAFAILGQVSLIELKQPPRRLTGFVSALCELVDFKAVVEPLAPRLQDWLPTLRGFGLEFSVTTLACSRVSLSSTARLSFTIRGTEDVRDYARAIAGTQQLQWDKVSLQVASQPMLNLTSQAVASGTRLSQDTCIMLRESLADLTSRVV